MSHDEMTCKRFILEYLAEYQDRSMPELERREFERHLSHCPSCLVFLKSYEATGRTLRMLKPRDIPRNLVDAVVSFVRAKCPKK